MKPTTTLPFTVLLTALLCASSMAADTTEIDQAVRRHRMGTLIIHASPAAEIRVEQLRHEFWFGAAISNGVFSDRADPADVARYKAVFLENFNAAVTENALKWHAMERERSKVHYETVDAILAWTQRHNIPLRGHCLFWGTPGRVQDWVKRLGDDDLRQVVRNRAVTVAARYRGRFAEYDLLAGFGAARSWRDHSEWADRGGRLSVSHGRRGRAGSLDRESTSGRGRAELGLGCGRGRRQRRNRGDLHRGLGPAFPSHSARRAAGHVASSLGANSSPGWTGRTARD